MSLFEWLGERSSPGPVGDIDHGEPGPGHWHPSVIIGRGALSIALLVGAAWWIVTRSGSTEEAVVSLSVLAAYSIVAYWITPRPDYDNVGMAGGLIDHPFRWSDDANRLLIFVKLLLWPGRFVTVGVRDLINLARGRRALVLPRGDR